MEPALFILAIMGCGDGGSACSEVRAMPAQYRSIAECHAAMPAALNASTNLDFPELSAACRRTTPVMVREVKPATTG